ncbi:hypothetical protein GLOIN_2v1781806 [Rhizophagus clarus]|uniref:Uncharacterized protein n=1 Tax=Rhizophagus clarus TaxID=94130 RepID=A0A8H3LFS6_9GLOM|nr:hypothetical protein GLOIN_2v1781806 [Rhizophagus clarus]
MDDENIQIDEHVNENDKLIEGWIVEDSKLILDPQVNIYKLPDKWRRCTCTAIKVNDSRIICYALGGESDGLEIFKMSADGHQKIKLNPPRAVWLPKIHLRKNGNLVIFNDHNEISVYSPHDQIGDELILMSSYKLTYHAKEVIQANEVIIDENSYIWAISSNYLFHWNLETLQLKFSYSLGFTVTNYGSDNNMLTEYIFQLEIFD